MTHASLFSGIGAAELAAQWLGWENKFHCEIDNFCRTILKYHFPNEKSYNDIKLQDFSKWGGQIDVLSGGFPCQPFSLAGRRRGAEDDRYLWPEFVRAINEIRPRWVVGENVAGILSMVQQGEASYMAKNSSLFGEDNHTITRHKYVIDTIFNDLEKSGYSVRAVLIPACAVGAPHRRDRVFIIANSSNAGAKILQKWEDGFSTAQPTADTTRKQSNRCEFTPSGISGQEQRQPRRSGCEDNSIYGLPQECWLNFPTTEPAVCGGNDGLPFDVDNLTVPYSQWRKQTLKAYGNAIVPQVIYEIFRAIELTSQSHKQ